MNKRIKAPASLIAGIGMVVLLFNPQTALQGAQEGVELCLRTVIPALFPFFILSCVICSSLLGKTLGILKPICRVCRIPQGAESLLILRLVGGYPVGAQSITQAYQGGSLDRSSAMRMLGFCSNAGPSFIFGIAGSLFINRWTPWLLWSIQIVSALIVGALLPGNEGNQTRIHTTHPVTLVQAMERSIQNMASVCGWVILFRVLISLSKRWFLWRLPLLCQVLLVGALELTNGCIALQSIESEAIRFLLCSGLLSFGGLCVGMQTVAVTKQLGSGYYFPGKTLQSLFSVSLAAAVLPLCFPVKENYAILLLVPILTATLLFLYRKNSSRNAAQTVI